MEAGWLAASGGAQLESLARTVRGKQSRLQRKVKDTSNFNKKKWMEQGLDAKWRSLHHKRRPTVRKIKGSNWRLAGTAHSDNTYAEQLAISKTLADMIRSSGAKARVIKWKKQVGVYFQPRLDPLEQIWGGVTDSSGKSLRTKKPASFVWQPAIYGRKKKGLLERMENEARNHLPAFIPGTQVEGRRLMVMREPANASFQEQYGMSNGISLGWVTREEAVKLLAEKGVYALGPEFEAAFGNVKVKTPSGLKGAEKKHLERELFKESLDIYRRPIPWNQYQNPVHGKLASSEDIDDFSWMVLDTAENKGVLAHPWSSTDFKGNLLQRYTTEQEEQPAINNSLYALYDEMNAIGFGEMGHQLDSIDLHNAYYAFLKDDGYNEGEIEDIMLDTAACELQELFHCGKTARKLAEQSTASRVRLEKITGIRKDVKGDVIHDKAILKPNRIDWTESNSTQKRILHPRKDILWGKEATATETGDEPVGMEHFEGMSPKSRRDNFNSRLPDPVKAKAGLEPDSVKGDLWRDE